MLAPSPIELAMILVIALIVLGPKRLPDAARSLGKGMREMRDSFQAKDDDEDDEDHEEDLAGELPDDHAGELPDDAAGESDAAPEAAPGRS